MSKQFTDSLLAWDRDQNHRPMPWKGEQDPYKIWLSEIILQQTRVEQGWAYYEKFIQHFPSIFDLAKAKEQKVFKLWEGLGYYNRCRNLLFTAKQIVKEYNGLFPKDYNQLVALKGVGPYTASAIASFAFNLPYAVLDGNVFRVFARYYGIETPIDTKEGVSIFNAIAQEHLSQKQPGVYNQALMDFGATVCKPLAPLCSDCVMQKKCVAFGLNKVNQLPIKLKRIQKKKRNFDFYCFEWEGKWLVQKREGGDIWNGLYQFYMLEQEKQTALDWLSVQQILSAQLGFKKQNFKSSIVQVFAPFQQQLTHQTIHARFIVVPLKTIPSVFKEAKWVTPQQMKKLPFPKLVNDFLDQEFNKI